MSDMIREYVERVEKLRQARASRITEEDLQEIARDVGLSDADLEAVEHEVQNHYDRGNGFVDHAMWDDAVRELSEASALAPTRVYILYALANAHYGRLLANPSGGDREAAERYARVCLDHDANYQPAYALLAKLNEADASAGPSPEEARQEALARRVLVQALLGVFVIIGMSTSMAIFLNTPDEDVANEPTRAVTPVEPPASSDGDEPPARLGQSSGGMPVEIVPTAVSGGLVVNIHESRHSVYGANSYYSLKGTLFNGSAREMTEVEGTMTFYDANDAEVATKEIDLHTTTGGDMRPGDSGPFYTTISVPAEATRMALTMHTVKATPAPAEYDPGKKVTLDWKVPKPGHLNFEFWERRSFADKSPYMKDKYWKHQFAVVNSGDAPIKTMRVEAVYLNASGKKVGADDWLISFSGSPPIMPGETWCEGGVRQVPGSYVDYKMRIVEIE